MSVEQQGRDGVAAALGATPMKLEPCMYVFRGKGNRVADSKHGEVYGLIKVHVDDVEGAGNTKTFICPCLFGTQE